MRKIKEKDVSGQVVAPTDIILSRFRKDTKAIDEGFKEDMNAIEERFREYLKATNDRFREDILAINKQWGALAAKIHKLRRKS